MSRRFASEVLYCMVTSNPVHLLVWTEHGGGPVSEAMRFLPGTAAQDHKRRTGRRGAFWSDRYHPTLVQSGVRLSRCLFYVDLNTVLPAGALPGTGTGAGVAQDGVTYGLHVSRRVLDPLQDGAPATLADKT